MSRQKQDLHGLRLETVNIQYVDLLQPFSALLTKFVLLMSPTFFILFVLSRSLKESSAFR